MQITAMSQSQESHSNNLQVVWKSREDGTVERSRMDDVIASCAQFKKEHATPEQLKYCPQFVALVLGHTLTRRISNLLSCVGLSGFYDAQRDYPILPSSPERLELAKKYAPILSSISESQAKCAQTNRSEVRYELIPPGDECKYYSLIYYLGFPTERMPISLLDRLYEWVRPVLYGSKKDWEAIQIDLDPKSMEPVAVSFETSNHLNDPASYNTLRSEDLHLKCRISKSENGLWKKVVTQQNDRTNEFEVSNPFVSGGMHPCFTIVSWNGSLELSSEISDKPNMKTYRISTSEVRFLDLETFQNEGIDLRVGWLKDRKFGKFLLNLAPRKVSNS